MIHNYSAVLEKELLEKLFKFRDNLKSRVRQNIFNREINFFKKTGLIHKISLAYDITTTLKRAQIHTGVGCSSTLPSYIYYLLNFIKTDPFEHGIIFEQIRENNPFMSIDFNIGESDRDRLLSILTMNYSATIKKDFETKDKIGYTAFIDFQGLTRSKFYKTAQASQIIQPNINNAIATKFRFVFSKITDILQNAWYLIGEKEAPFFHPDKIIMSKIKNYPRQKISDFQNILSMTKQQNLIRKIDFHQPKSLQELTNLVALSNSDENKNPISLKYLKIIREKVTAKGDAISYYCSDLVADSYGVLFYKEQVYHILHHLCGISYKNAITIVDDLKSVQIRDKIKNDLIQKMVKNNIPKSKSSEIVENITNSIEFLFNNLDILPQSIRLHNFIYLLGSYPQELAESIQKFG